jgi:penicillin-binding protein 1C
MALGGVGVDLGDLAMLYAALADGGRALPLRLEKDASAPSGVPLMAEAAADQIEDILRGVAPPDGVAPAWSRAIAYKTGTSYGFRDALAIGGSADYTVAVWVGRTEGSPRPGAYGRNTAAPLLFRVFDLLPPEPAPSASQPTARAAKPMAAALQRFGQGDGFRSRASTAAALRIVFPPAGARIELARREDAAVPLALEAAGGVPPYRWAINGQPLPQAPAGVSPSWRPDGPGFATVSVTDSLQRTTVAEVRLD